MVISIPYSLVELESSQTLSNKIKRKNYKAYIAKNDEKLMLKLEQRSIRIRRLCKGNKHRITFAWPGSTAREGVAKEAMVEEAVG